MRSRFVALSVSLTQKVSGLPGQGLRTELCDDREGYPRGIPQAAADPRLRGAGPDEGHGKQTNQRRTMPKLL